MILGVDLGKRKTGLAISAGELATPYKTIHHQNLKQILVSIIRIIETEQIKTVVIGYVLGKNTPFFENFARLLKLQKPDLDIVLRDETLSTRQAKSAMSKLSIRKSRRQILEDQFAAADILQSYLDENK